MKPTTLKILSIIAIFIGILVILFPLISYYTTPIWFRETGQEMCLVAGIFFGIILICGGIIDYFRAEKEMLGKKSDGEITAETKDESLKILKLRYAKGEISKEEFEQMKKDLES